MPVRAMMSSAVRLRATGAVVTNSLTMSLAFSAYRGGEFTLKFCLQLKNDKSDTKKLSWECRQFCKIGEPVRLRPFLLNSS